uniref:Uncharacterized protein n=1 Tax=Rhizophora mucronata TaxID=61149 RepID=A0A2P2NYM4_RHIMU
MVSLYSNLW